MKIRELIQTLSQLDPELPVVVRGYEGGYNDVSEVNTIAIPLNINTRWYYGTHGDTDESPRNSETSPKVPVVYLRGYNHLAEEDWHGY